MINIDKTYHFLAGMLLALGGGILHSVLGLVLGVAYGVGKEIYDYYNKDKHTPDGSDMVATVVGALLGYEIVKLM